MKDRHWAVSRAAAVTVWTICPVDSMPSPQRPALGVLRPGRGVAAFALPCCDSLTTFIGMAEKRTLRYQGSPMFVSALAKMLREEGVVVCYEPPEEQRGVAQDFAVGVAASATTYLLCEGLRPIGRAVAHGFQSAVTGTPYRAVSASP